MSIKQKIRKILTTLEIIGFIIIIVIGFCEVRFFATYIYTPLQSIEKGWAYLGQIGDRKIHATTTGWKDKNVSCFAMKADGHLVYIEYDNNNDGIADSIVHFDKGVEAYSSHDIDSDGIIDRKTSELYKNGIHKSTIMDLNLDNNFDVKFIYSEDGKNIISKEIFIKNQWIKRVTQESQHGIYDDSGSFLPVKFDNGQWITVENSMEGIKRK